MSDEVQDLINIIYEKNISNQVQNTSEKILRKSSKAKYRIFDETDKVPAIVLGIDTQGRGSYHELYTVTDDAGVLNKDLNRYDQKALGLYLVVSRNFEALGNDPETIAKVLFGRGFATWFRAA